MRVGFFVRGLSTLIHDKTIMSVQVQVSANVSKDFVPYQVSGSTFLLVDLSKFGKTHQNHNLMEDHEEIRTVCD